MGAAVAIPLVITAVQTAVGVAGSEQERARGEKEAGENKALAMRAAADAVARGTAEAGRTRMEGTKLIARQRVAYATSGVDPTVGTPAAVMADTRATTELDALTLENNAAREAWGFKTHGMQYGQQADRENERGRNRTMGTVLGGLGKAAGQLGDYYGSKS